MNENIFRLFSNDFTVYKQTGLKSWIFLTKSQTVADYLIILLSSTDTSATVFSRSVVFFYLRIKKDFEKIRTQTCLLDRVPEPERPKTGPCFLNIFAGFGGFHILAFWLSFMILAWCTCINLRQFFGVCSYRTVCFK